MHTSLFAVSVVAAVLLIPLAASNAVAQCPTGCENHDSCGGEGSEACSADCWNEEDVGEMCVCANDPCENFASLNAARSFRTVAATYKGPGYALPVSVHTYLIEDCQGNVFGPTFTRARATQIEHQLRVIALAEPDRRLRRLVARSN